MNRTNWMKRFALLSVVVVMAFVVPHVRAYTRSISEFDDERQGPVALARMREAAAPARSSPSEVVRKALPQKRTQPDGGPLVRTVLIGGDGTSIQVAVQVENMTNLAAFDVDVNILGDVVRWQEGTLGDFLALTGRTVYTMGMQITESGATFPAAAYTTGDQSGVDGSGTLLTLDASVEAEGIGYLVFGRALFGTPNGDPIIVSREVDAVQVQSIHKGWNLVALCPDVSGQTISDVFRTIDGQYDALLDANQQTPTVLTGGSGVWVRGTNSVATRLTTLGVARDATASLALSPGWQLVAYCGEATLALDEALASIAGQYDRVIGLSGAYDPQVGAAYQTLTQLTPGDVILLHMTEQAFLRFPASGDAGQVVQNDCPAIAPTPYMSLLYGDVTWNGAPPSAGMRIEALNIDDEVVGCAATDDAGRFGLMTLYGRDEAAGIPGYAPNEPIRLRVGTCVVESTLLWQDDRTPHRVDIAGTDQGCEITVRENRTFLPFVVR